MLDQHHLQSFLKIAETGSFSQAAEQLYITQPAISKRIAALEQTLNIKLFDRIGRQVQLTQAGRVFREHAQRILLTMEDSQRALDRLSDSISGTLKLATSHHIGLHHLPPILKHFCQNYPNVQLDIQFMDSEQACQAVLKGVLEMAIVTLPLTMEKPLSQTPLWQDPLSIVIGLTHPLHPPLEQLGFRLSLKQLSLLTDHPALLPAAGTYTRTLVDQAFAEAGLHINTHMPSNYLETLKMMVGVGLGWSVLPNTLLSDELRVIETPVTLTRRLGVVSHTQRTQSNAAQKLLEILQEASESQ